MKLSQRLLTIASFVESDSVVADVGTDHGYVPGYLIENNISKKVIGTDISKGSLEKIIEYIKSLGFEHKVESRLGDGLVPIKTDEVDTVIIAGMGGLLIRDILDKDKVKTNSIKNFILQPMVAAKELRQYLYANDFQIIKEELVKEDNKYYEIIHAKKGKSKVDKDIYYEIGQYLVENKHPILKEFIEFRINGAKKITEEIRDNENQKSKERYLQLLNDIKNYQEVLDSLES